MYKNLAKHVEVDSIRADPRQLSDITPNQFGSNQLLGNEPRLLSTNPFYWRRQIGLSLKIWPFALYCNLSPLYPWFVVVTKGLSPFPEDMLPHAVLQELSHSSPSLISFSQLQSFLIIKAPLIQLVSFSGTSTLEVTDGGSPLHLLFINLSTSRCLAFFKVPKDEKQLSHHDEHLYPSTVICC